MYRLALAGNPNSGKTTLFNALTGTNQSVGNWPGVTVEKKEGRARGRKDIVITDLPGIYSLSPYSLEEIITRDYLLNETPDAIVNLVDGSNLERNLYLTTQLLELGIPTVLAINMMDIVQKRGDEIDVKRLEADLGCPVVPIIASKARNLKALLDAAVAAVELKKIPKEQHYDESIEAALREIESLVGETLPEKERRWYCIKLLERDEKVSQAFSFAPGRLEAVEAVIQKVEKKADDDILSLFIGERYDLVKRLLKDSYKKVLRAKLTSSDKIDRIVTNRVLGLPIFVAIMFGVYWLATFGGGLGKFVGDFTNDTIITEWIQNPIVEALENWGVTDWLVSLLGDGVIAGVGAVLGFLPQMFILFFMLSLLEQCGYMARIAFLMDRVFRKFGLSGKSFIPILISSGCAVPGVMATRTIENEKDRRMTVMVSSFIPCGAKLPIIALLAACMFDDSWWFAPLVYFVCIAVIILSGIILKKTKVFAGDPAPFVMELPPYHIPNAKNLFLQIWERLRSFVIKAGTIIFASSIVIWVLMNLDWSFQYLDGEIENSIGASLGRALGVFFAPLGFGDWRAVISALGGLVAKENLLSTFAIANSLSDIAEDVVDQPELLNEVFNGLFVTKVAGFSFLVFNMICAPCFAAVGSIRREMSSMKWTWIAIGYQMLASYLLSFLIFQLGTFLTGGAFTLAVGIAFACLAVVLYFLFRPNPYKLGLKA